MKFYCDDILYTLEAHGFSIRRRWKREDGHFMIGFEKMGTDYTIEYKLRWFTITRDYPNCDTLLYTSDYDACIKFISDYM